jgi:hypothetical protein
MTANQDRAASQAAKRAPVNRSSRTAKGRGWADRTETRQETATVSESSASDPAKAQASVLACRSRTEMASPAQCPEVAEGHGGAAVALE